MQFFGHLFSKEIRLETDLNKVNSLAYGGKWDYFEKEGVKIFFNGLIYNSKDIFGENEKSISENILDAFLKEGEKFFRKISGKASIVIVYEDKAVIFRDHHGEARPVFIYENFVADSMQGILQLKESAHKAEKRSIKCFLKYGFIPAPLTAVKDVLKVPAGEYVVIKPDKAILFENIFDYNDFNADKLNISMNEAIEEYDRLLKQSIKRRINSFDKVGALLSGGYDSGGNIAAIREVFEGDIYTYSIGFKDNPFSELPYAKMMADKFNSYHHEYKMDGSEISQLPDIIKAFGEPFSESGFMLNNSAMRFVKDEGLPVVIGGDGNDQLFGTTAKELALHHRIKSFGGQFLQKMFRSVSQNDKFDNDNILFKLRFHNEKILNVMRPDNFGFNENQISKLFHLHQIDEHTSFSNIPKKYSDFTNFHDQHHFYLDIRYSINEVILNKASRLSDYYGVNMGFSYVDTDIYNFLTQLPLNIRLKGNVKELAAGKGVTKYLHKQHTKPKLPEEVTNRKKQGGFSPLAIFFKEKAKRDKLYDYILESSFAKEMTNIEALKSFFKDYDAKVSDNPYWFWFKQVKSNQLMNLLVMAVWWDIFIEGKEVEL